MAMPSALPDEALPPYLGVICAPVHKRALGVAVGLTAAALVFLVTVFHLIVQPPGAVNLTLLSQYFYGYEVSAKGAAIGAFWASVSGFVGGWFLGFVRNLCVAIWVRYLSARAELANTHDFLDHI
jgi:hypothetical protein